MFVLELSTVMLTRLQISLLFSTIMFCSAFRYKSISRANYLLKRGCSLSAVAELPNNSNNDLLKIRHSAAHVMAMAVQRLFPTAKVAIGPWIEHGYVQHFSLLCSILIKFYTVLCHFTDFSMIFIFLMFIFNLITFRKSRRKW
jgi:hypothetical protein